MIHSPNPAVDSQMLTQSRELVREAMALLRNSDHLVSGQRLRDELQQERHRPQRREVRSVNRRSEQMREGKPDGHRPIQDNGGVR
jgi:hypothetical protein